MKHVYRSGGDNEKAWTIKQRIKNELGSDLLLNYYMFINHYNRDPLDMRDLFDGTLALGIILELEGPRL